MRQVLRQHKRYWGIVLSIAFGTAGVIVILTMGDEVKVNLNKDLTLLGGATVIDVHYEQGLEDQDRLMHLEWFRPASLRAVRAIPDVTAVSLTVLKEHSGAATVGNDVFKFSLMGVDEYYWEVNGFMPSDGSFFGAKAVEQRKRVCVLGQKLALRIFKMIEVSGQLLRIDGSMYRVVGILSDATSGELAQAAFIPLTTAQDRIEDLPKSNTMLVRCRTWDDVKRVSEAIPETIGQAQSTQGLTVKVLWGSLTHVKRIYFWVELFIYLSVGATLGLGGFGIWNGMMTAVKSRTREIGLKKAMGAEDLDILVQFLGEAMFLSLAAGVIGIAMGFVGVEVAAWKLNTRAPLHLAMVYTALSLVFSLALGGVAGYYPALRASRMEVVSAIRYE